MVFFNPAFELMASRGVLGVNMLRIADEQPAVLKRCMEEVVKLWENGVCKPTVGAEFEASQLAEAHRFLEERKSIGKIIVKW